MASGVFIIFLILVAAFGGPLAKHLIGHGPNDLFIGFGGVCARERVREAAAAYETADGLEFPGVSLLSAAARDRRIVGA